MNVVGFQWGSSGVPVGFLWGPVGGSQVLAENVQDLYGILMGTSKYQKGLSRNGPEAIL